MQPGKKCLTKLLPLVAANKIDFSGLEDWGSATRAVKVVMR